MTQENRPHFDSLHQFAKGSEQVFDINFSNRLGQARLFTTEQFTLVDASFTPGPQAAVWRHHNQRPLVEMNFVLSGQLWQSHSGLLQQQAYVAGYHNCLFNPDSLEENELAGGKDFHMLSVQLDPDAMIRLLMDYAPELEGIAQKLSERVPFVRHSPVLGYPDPIRYLLKTGWQGPTNPGLKRLHVDSIGLQLLCYQLDHLFQARPASASVAITRSEKDKLYHARELLLAQLSEPPGLTSLAKACQLNEFSLKKGFKQLFGTTVYGFVLQQRMEAARTALFTGEKTVSEIAYELGYAHAQHFHRAFKNYYGVTPKTLKRGL